MNHFFKLFKTGTSVSLLFVFIIASFSTTLIGGEKSSNKLQNIFEVIKNRRSVRKFKSTSVSREDIEKIIKTACMAPTSGNQQPWKFVVIDDRKILDEIYKESIEQKLLNYKKYYKDKDKSKLTPENIAITRKKYEKYVSGFLSAPVYIAIYTDSKSKYPSYNHYDGPLAAGYLMLAARAMGYGTVFATDSIPVSVTKKVLNIPDNYVRVCFTPLGVPEEWPSTPSKKDVKEFIIFGKIK